MDNFSMAHCSLEPSSALGTLERSTANECNFVLLFKNKFIQTTAELLLELIDHSASVWLNQIVEPSGSVPFSECTFPC